MPPRRRPPRSNGCQQCLQRHVKCDGRPYSCKQCTRFGLMCSGAIQGPIILDMTARIKSKTKRTMYTPLQRNLQRNILAMETDFEVSEPGDQLTPEPSQHHIGGTDECQHSSISADTGNPGPEQAIFHHRQQELLHGLNADLFEQYFVARFVQLIASVRRETGRPRSWVLEIPQLLMAARNPSVKYSIRAAALVHYAVAFEDKQAKIDALQWYLAGMECHRVTIASSQAQMPPEARTSRGLYDLEEICAPMLFAYYETMSATTATAWSQHQTAVAEILEGRGPTSCQEGLAHTMFRSVRTCEALQSVLKARPSRFDSSVWCSTPFTSSVKSTFDLLIDIVITIPSKLNLPLHEEGNMLPECIHNISALETPQRFEMGHEARYLMSRLQDWWWYFATSNNNNASLPDKPGADYIAIDNDIEPNNPKTSAMVPHTYLDTLTASSVALYSAANIILHTVLLTLALLQPHSDQGISPVPRHTTSIESYSASIIQAAAFQARENRFCGDTLRTLFPLKIVSVLGLNEDHCRQARDMITDWGYGDLM